MKKMLVADYDDTFYKNEEDLNENLKYFKKQSKDEIEETLKFDFKKQKIIKDKLIEFVYKNAKMRNLV